VLLELFPQGVEELPDGFAVYTDDEGERQLRERFDVTSEPFAEGWEEAWREFHHGLVVGRLWIGPPWERAEADVTPVIVDPGRAFGTGAHATTRLSLELLQEAELTSLLDVGCGSGVLAIAAAKIGFAPVVAVDVEQDAVETTLANARVNGVDLSAYRADALADDLPAAGLVTANIALGAVRRVLARIDAPRAIVSGYLDRDELEVAGWRRVERRDREGWAADLLERELS